MDNWIGLPHGFKNSLYFLKAQSQDWKEINVCKRSDFSSIN